VYLNWVADEVAGISRFLEALLTGRDERGRDRIPNDLPGEHKLLLNFLVQGFHIPYHASVLPLPACQRADSCKMHNINPTSIKIYVQGANPSRYRVLKNCDSRSHIIQAE
jgi:hypothetical protein